MNLTNITTLSNLFHSLQKLNTNAVLKHVLQQEQPMLLKAIQVQMQCCVFMLHNPEVVADLSAEKVILNTQKICSNTECIQNLVNLHYNADSVKLIPPKNWSYLIQSVMVH